MIGRMVSWYWFAFFVLFIKIYLKKTYLCSHRKTACKYILSGSYNPGGNLENPVIWKLWNSFHSPGKPQEIVKAVILWVVQVFFGDTIPFSDFFPHMQTPEIYIVTP